MANILIFIRHNRTTKKKNTMINRYFYLYGKDKHLHRQNHRTSHG